MKLKLINWLKKYSHIIIFFILGLIFGLIIFGLILSGSLGEKNVPKKANSSSILDKNMEIKKTACYSAASYGGCEQALREAKIASAEECCALFEKCCITG